MSQPKRRWSWFLWRIFGPLRGPFVDKRYTDCYNCFHSFDTFEEPYFVCTESGVMGLEAIRWWRGIQTCPRCFIKFDIEDSE